MFLRGFFKSIKEGVIRKATITGRVDETKVVSHYQHYGFSSMPASDPMMDCVCLEDGNNTAIVAEDNGNLRPPLTTGQVCLYVDTNNYILMDADGSLTIKTKDKPVTIDSGSGDVTVKTTGSLKLGDASGTQELMTKAYADAIVQYFAQIVTGFLSVPYTLPAFVAPTTGLTSTTEAK